MKKPTILRINALFICTMITFTNCKEKEEEQKDDPIMATNTLLKEWTGPYDGVPGFDKMKVSDVKEAVEKGMELGLKDIEAIANNAERATFENTIVAMERSGKVLDQVFKYYGIMSSNVSTPEFRDIQTELAPKISEYNS